MPARLVITVPVPPSVNNYYAVVRGRKITSAAGRAWQRDAISGIRKQLKRIVPIKREVAIDATWFRARKAGDLSNRIKPAEDVLVKAGILEDDSQISELHWKRREDKKNPRIELTITEIE